MVLLGHAKDTEVCPEKMQLGVFIAATGGPQNVEIREGYFFFSSKKQQESLSSIILL